MVGSHGLRSSRINEISYLFRIEVGLCLRICAGMMFCELCDVCNLGDASFEAGFTRVWNRCSIDLLYNPAAISCLPLPNSL